MMNKMYQFVNEATVLGEKLLPIRMQSDDVPEAPPYDPPVVSEETLPKNKRVYIVVDPIPEEWDESAIKSLCEKEQGAYTLAINGSANFRGRKRALLQPTTSRAKKRLPKILNREINGVPLRPLRVPCNDLPPSLEAGPPSE
jgi:hypothetical protein